MCEASHVIRLSCRAPSCRQHLEKASRASGSPSSEETGPMSSSRSKTSFRMGLRHMTTRSPQVNFLSCRPVSGLHFWLSSPRVHACNVKSYKEGVEGETDFLSKQNITRCHIHICTVCLARTPMYTVKLGLASGHT